MTLHTNKISTCLWFDGQAEEAAQFYTAVFENAKINNTAPYQVETPAEKRIGSVMTVDFQVENLHFVGLNGGPMFKANPAISFFYTCDSKDQADELWQKLSNNGKALMPLEEYPFSAYYGWVQDKFGISWQLILNNPEGEPRPKMMPSLLFTKAQLGKAEEAMHFYTSVFADSKISENINHYTAGMLEREGMLAFGDFTLLNHWFAAMDSGNEQDFSFNEAISIMVHCDSQDEIDAYWQKLSAVPEAEQCGWLKDKYGLSWQIIPKNMGELISSKKAMQAMMQMKKIDIETLRNA